MKLCRDQLEWKSPTTFTVIRRLAERGVLKNENTIVTSLVSKAEVQAAELDELMEDTFEGSVPAFLTAFAKNREMTEDDIKAIEEMIAQYKKRGE